MAGKSDIQDVLAQRLKEARQARGLSLDAVAKLSGVSRSMVSQIERGSSSPTVATLWNLTNALQVDFAELLDRTVQKQQIEVITAARAPTIEGHGDGCQIRILSPPDQVGKHEVYELEFDADGQLDSTAHDAGTREHLTVISGQVSVTSGEETRHLGPGDTGRYAADVPHKILAIGGSARAFLIVIGENPS